MIAVGIGIGTSFIPSEGLLDEVDSDLGLRNEEETLWLVGEDGVTFLIGE